MPDDMPDELLLSYAAIHCQTERALFHQEHIQRIATLAGMEFPLVGRPKFVAVRERTMLPLVEAARKRLQAR